MNTTSETKRSKGIPKGRGKHLTVGGSATRGVGSRVKERERAKETDILVEKGKDISPSNVSTGIRNAGRGEENALMVIQDTIRSTGETMPERPPAARGVAERSVIRMLSIEVAVVSTRSGKISRSRIGKGRIKIHLDEVPARPEGASRSVRDEKQAIHGSSDSSKKGGSRGRRKRNRRVVVG